MSVGELLVMAVCAIIGSAAGFGLSGLLTPTLLLFGMDARAVIFVVLFVSMTARISVIFQLWTDVWKRVALILVVSSLPGMLLGSELSGRMSSRSLAICAAGAAVLGATVAIGAYRVSSRVRVSTFVWCLVGFVGGLMAPTTSLNGIFAAPLLADGRRPAAQIASTLAVYFVAANSITLGVLALRSWGEIPVTLYDLVVVGVVAVAAGSVGGRLTRYIPQRPFRFLVIGLILFSAIMVVFRSVVSL